MTPATLLGLPLGDPQFWIVTGGAFLAFGFAVRKLRRGARSGPEMPCDRCPKPGDPRGPRPGASGSRGLGVVFAAALAGASPLAAATVERQVASMGTALRVHVETEDDRSAALAIAETLIRAVESTEERLSTWRESSELARVNRTPVGEWIASGASAELDAAARCARDTGFAFHPALGRLVAAWDLRGGGRLPTEIEIRAARAGLDGPGFEIDRGGNLARRTADVILEEGGFGKGAGLDAALGALARLPSTGGPGFVRLDLGGQVAWTNARQPVRVDVADPRDRARAVLELVVGARRGSLASSGNSEKLFTFDDRSFGHLIDPRTGSPAPDFGSVAVVAQSGLWADCLSTALFVMGPEAGARWLAGRGGAVEAAFLVLDGARIRARMTAGLARRARPLTGELEIEVLNSSS